MQSSINKQSFLWHLRRIVLVVLLPALFLHTVSCQKKTVGLAEKITIAYSTASNALLVYIAFAKGYFAEEGLDATPQPYPFGKLALKAVLDGRADLGTSADTPIMFAVMNGEKITTLAAIQTSNKDNAIVARQDRGILTPEDLKGKRIGVTLGTNANFFLDAFLLEHGIDIHNVKIIDMKPEEMSVAIVAGKVDAVSTFNPTIILLKQELGSKGTVFFGDTIYTENFCLAAMQDYVKKHPDTVRKILSALIRAETFARENPEEARRLVADFIHIDKNLLDAMWPIYSIRLTLDQALLVDLEDQTRWALKSKRTVLKDMPNYLNFIYADGLLSVKPEAVRILR